MKTAKDYYRQLTPFSTSQEVQACVTGTRRDNLWIPQSREQLEALRGYIDLLLSESSEQFTLMFSGELSEEFQLDQDGNKTNNETAVV